MQEQAKKIENLSSMVLLSNRDEKREQDHFKKVFSFSSILCLVIPFEFKQHLLGVIHLFQNAGKEERYMVYWSPFTGFNIRGKIV